MGSKILNSDNDELKQRVLSGKTSITAGYKELQNKNKPKVDEVVEKPVEKENNTTKPDTRLQITPLEKVEISEKVRQVCQDLKTEKSKEHLESIWNYKVSIIECMNEGFKRYYPGFVSILNEMNGRVSREELNDCIRAAEENILLMRDAVNAAKNTKLKTEE